MTKQLKIKAKLETSTHCGYCTGSECEYESNVKSYYVPIPEKLDWLNDDNHGSIVKISMFNWQTLLPKPDVDGHYETCSCSNVVVEAGLSRHDYRYTILKVRVVEKSNK